MSKILEKYNHLSLPIKAGIWFTILQYTQEAIVIAATPIFTRIMSESEYGIVNVYNTWQGLLTVFMTLKISAGIYQIQLFEYKKDRENLTSSLVTFSTMLIILFSAIPVLFGGQIEYLLALPLDMIFVMIFDIWAQMVISFWLTRYRFEYIYKKCVIVITLCCFTRTLSSVLFTIYATSNQSFYKVFGNLLPELIIAIGLLFVLLKKGKRWFEKKYWKEAFNFNIILVPSYLSAILLSSSDRLMINYYCTSAEVALYSIAYSCAHLVQLFFSAINWVYTPYAYEQLEKKNYKALRKSANLLTAMMAFLTGILIVFAPEAIKIFAPKSYLTAIWVIPPSACGIFLTFLYGFFVNVEYFKKKNKQITIATVIGAIVNVVLNMLFIPMFGYLVAAYTTVIGYLVMTVVHYYFYRKIIDEPIFNVKLFVIITVALYIFGFVCLALYKYMIIRYVLVVLMGLYAMKKRKIIISSFKEMNKNKKQR